MNMAVDREDSGGLQSKTGRGSSRGVVPFSKDHNLCTVE